MNGVKAPTAKRQRLEEEEPGSVGIKLSHEMRGPSEGRKHAKEAELTRAVLLEWAKR
jgi:hypothetical protein